MKNLVSSMRILVAAISCFALVGCAHYAWVNRSLSSADAPARFAGDQSECTARGYQSVPGSETPQYKDCGPYTKANQECYRARGQAVSAQSTRDEIVAGCMQGKGWSLERQ